jgi:BirA family transcriptional regulator, biotin operon repressor / biotin---[acetyl-CoA-carboxylase] ligase
MVEEPLHPFEPSLAPTPERLAACLRTSWLGRPYEWHPSCASTNDLAAARGRSGSAEGLVIAADAQTGGRGRQGRLWHSPAGENLYVSLLLRPARPAAEIPPLTLLAGAAVAEALATLGARPRLKWPNDVLLEEDHAERKVAGVLTEMASEGERVGHVVLGLGLNVNAAEFPADLAGRATSLRRVLGRPLDRAAVLAALLASLERHYDAFRARGPAAAVAAWRPYAALGGKWRVNLPAGALEGVALGIDPDGALLLRDDVGHVHRVLSGEVLR